MDNLIPEKINSLARDDLDELLANFCEQGKLEEVKYLLTSSDIIKKPSLKKTAYYPLSAAARGGQIEVLRYLLTSKDTKNRINFHYSADYALVSASENGQFEVVKYLLTSPELKEPANIHIQTEGALRGAIENKHFEIARYLITSNDLKEKADANSALFTFCNDGDLEGVRFLTSQEFKEYVDIHYHDNTPFAIAISKNNIELFKYLMFDYKIERTHHIKMILNYASPEILKVLESEKLSKELNSELNNSNNKEKIMKI